MPVAENILKNCNLFVDGRGFAGNFKEFKLPELSVSLESFRAGGMDAPVSIDKGMEELTFSFTVTKHCAETLAQFGAKQNGGIQLIARGSLENFDGKVTPVTVNMTGNITKIAPAAWSAGGEVTTEYTMNLSYYKYAQDGVAIHEIDVMNMKRIINGTDQLAEQRAALGL